MYMVIAYDIADARRLTRVAKAMEDYGSRVQYSIFEAELHDGALRRLQARITHIIDEEADGVKYFPLCHRCMQSVRVHGRGGLPEYSATHLVL